ncbi:alpha/beta hydrolase [Streptomyces sp. LBUM 1485]|nr:alpha/beta hydrolase [Streptomyces sp. LBUM 1485]
MAASLGAVVVSADYRRAPEFPYPTPLLDAVAAARWAGRAFPGREHVLAGDSAGASLAIGVALDARDSGELRFAAQLLLYPPVDPRLLFAAAGEHAEGYLLSVDDMAYHYDLYVPDLERRLDPAIDLLSADLRHLPPTVVATAEFDPLHDEGVELADKLAVAGVPVRHVPGPGLVHGYFLMQDIVPAAATRSRDVLQELETMLRATRRPAPGGTPKRWGWTEPPGRPDRPGARADEAPTGNLPGRRLDPWVAAVRRRPASGVARAAPPPRPARGRRTAPSVPRPGTAVASPRAGSSRSWCAAPRRAAAGIHR